MKNPKKLNHLNYFEVINPEKINGGFHEKGVCIEIVKCITIEVKECVTLELKPCITIEIHCPSDFSWNPK